MYEIDYYKRDYTPIFFVIDNNGSFDSELFLDHKIVLAFDISNNKLGYVKFNNELDLIYKEEFLGEMSRAECNLNSFNHAYYLGDPIGTLVHPFNVIKRVSADRIDYKNTKFSVNEIEVDIKKKNLIDNNVDEILLYLKLVYS